ncbi:MAG: hypothetical protein CL913_01645 [Deltaproteobacteria bacterium]|nr:hypothetical protein [Deltaproteobacteria bacterium]
MEGEQALRVNSSKSRTTQVRIGFFLDSTNLQSFLALAYWRLATLPCAAILFRLIDYKHKADRCLVIFFPFCYRLPLLLPKLLVLKESKNR